MPEGAKPTAQRDAELNRSLGLVERVENGRVIGRAADFSGDPGPVILVPIIDDTPLEAFTCTTVHSDFYGKELSVEVWGFEIDIPSRFFDGHRHVVRVRFQGGDFVMFHGQSGELLDHGHFEIAEAELDRQSDDWRATLTDNQLLDVRTIEDAGAFDENWYRQSNPDLDTMAITPVCHYVLFGASEGRDPSPAFHTSVYVEHHGIDALGGENPFAHFLRHAPKDAPLDRGMLERFDPATVRRGLSFLRRFPLFDEREYLDLNSDVATAGVDPIHHAFTSGFSEGRAVFSRVRVSRVLGRIAKQKPVPPRAAVRKSSLRIADVAVYYNSLGNGFIRDIAQSLVGHLRLLGSRADLRNEKSDPEKLAPVNIIVAPHEFFQLGCGQNWAKDQIVSRFFMYNTEQPQTLWFERGIPFCLMSRGVIDVCAQTAEIFAACGLPSLYFTPMPAIVPSTLTAADLKHPMVRILAKKLRTPPQSSNPFSQRGIDISFFGNTSPRRDRFFTRNARYLAAHECYLYYRRFEGPQREQERDGALSRLAVHIAGHSKIALNIHRDEFGFFEWHRMVSTAMVQGALVVSEPNLPHPIYKPGQHFLEESGRHIPDLIDWLLRSEDGLTMAEKVRSAALALVGDIAIQRGSDHVLQQFLFARSASRGRDHHRLSA